MVITVLKVGNVFVSCRAQSSIKIMDVCQKTTGSRKVGMGVMELSSIKATCPNKQEVKAPTSTANTSKPTQLNCVNNKPCTVKQSDIPEPEGTNRTSNQHHGKKIFPMPKNVR